MGLAISLAVFFILWWIVLFTVLPLGVRTQEEDGDVVPGTTASAPRKPFLMRKFLLTTIVTSLLFGGIYLAAEYSLLSLDDIPFLPRF